MEDRVLARRTSLDVMFGGTDIAAMIYQYIPDELKPMFTPQEIQDMIDTALVAAKEYWEKNGNMF